MCSKTNALGVNKINTEKIIKSLCHYGLSNTESKVYCSCLALDGASVDQVAKHANVNRTSCYPILERLKEMGLVSQVKKRGKTIFQPVRPEKFYDLLDEKKEHIENIFPELKSLFDISRGRPDVRFHEGSEGLKTVLNTMIDETKSILIFGESDSFVKAIPGWMETYVERRAKKNIKVKLLLKASPHAIKSIKQIQASNEKIRKLTKVRMLPASYKIDYSGFDVYNNKIVLYSFEKQNNAVVIENTLISEMMRTVFGILWETAEKYNHLMK